MGGGYKYIENALNKQSAIAPTDMRLYHGVEYQEIEFYEQLKTFIKPSDKYPNQLDYSECVGKTITTNGFISTSTFYDKNNLTRFCMGTNWTNDDNFEPPLKEPALFIIDVKKGQKGLAFVSNPFKMIDFVNQEHQVIININKQFKINKWEKRKDYYNNVINVFWLDLV